MRPWANRSCAASVNEAPFQNHIPMISIPGQYGATCDGFSRREFLRIGGAGLAGLSLANILKLQAQQSAAAGPAASQPRRPKRSRPAARSRTIRRRARS